MEPLQPLHELPAIAVELDGQALAAVLVDALSSVWVRQELSAPSLCELTFADPAEHPNAEIGSRVAVYVGVDRAPIFVGRVTAVEHAHGPGAGYLLRLRAYDALQALRRRAPLRMHEPAEVRTFAESLMGDLGVRVVAEDAGPRVPHWLQRGEDDLLLLQQVTAQYGMYFALHDETVTLMGPGGLDDEARLLRYGERLVEAEFVANAEQGARTSAAWCWNPLLGTTFTGETSRPVKGRTSTFEVELAELGGDGRVEATNRVAPDHEHAERMARADLERRAAKEVVFRGQCEGDVRLRPGARVELRGITPAFEGRYVLGSVEHVFDAESGYVCRLSSALPPAPDLPEATTLAPGVVTHTDDPERLGRVRVRLPTFGALQTDFMRVLSPGAGPDSGLVFLPEVDDEVLVLLTGPWPSHGVVLGGVWREPPPDDGLDAGERSRVRLRTRRGQEIILDDRRGSLHLRNRSGSAVELDPGRVRVHAKNADLVLEAPGHGLTLRAKSVDFEQE